MIANLQENDWQLPDGFLESKTFLKHDIPSYEVPENSIKFFNFQTSVPPETAEEKAEQNRAIQDQIKLGILRVVQPPTAQESSATQFHPELQVSSTSPIITMLNGQEIHEVKQPQPNLLNEFANRVVMQQKRPVPIFGNNKKVGKNDPCPCGSGKKYKVCHGH